MYNLEDALTCDQLADELGVRPSTLRRWRQQGTGPEFIRPFYNVVLYRRAAVDAWKLERAAA